VPLQTPLNVLLLLLLLLLLLQDGLQPGAVCVLLCYRSTVC
jgi:hypothetical protein